MQVNRIEAIPKELPHKKKVAAYARVSSGKDAMLHSLAAQVSYYSDLIGRNPEWEFSGVFADEAITGTKKDRPQFKALLDECRAGQIDMVITKSISRLARNTVTVLQSVRELKALGVDIFFEEQNIHSFSSEGELMLTILSSYAQEESRSCSENCKWRIRKDFKEGRPNTGRMLGYRLVDGVLVIVPEEAILVREIFQSYLSGMGTTAIMKKYRDNGIMLSKNGIVKMLRNEKYHGDMRLQKTFVQDHISKKKRINRGELPSYYITGSHEPIIDKATFDAVQAEIAIRAEKYHHGEAGSKPKVYPFTGLITCGKCGASYRRKHAAAGSKYEKIVWICSTFNTLGKSECDSQQIPEDILMAKAAELSGIENITEILVPEHNRMIFALMDGTSRDIRWENPSRSRSWTPEMRDAARQKTLARYRKDQKP